MIFKTTDLEGAFIVELEPFQDDRGLFARTFCKEEFEKIGQKIEFVQINHSRNTNKGTLRGMHYQKAPHTEAKLVRCISGAVIDVIVDIRKNSPTYLKHVSVELSAQNMRMIFIPEGFAHGFQTLEDQTELIYHHTAFYSPHAEAGLRFDDPKLNITWPLTPSTMSKKDAAYPLIDASFKGI